MRRMPFSIAFVVLISASAALAADAVTINRASPSVEHRKFDRNNPPSDMPQLEPQEAAVTKSVYGIGTQFSVQLEGEQKKLGKSVARVKVTSVSVDVSLKITVWLPHDASRVIADHEEGHRKLSEYFYKDAEKIARNVAQGYVGKVYEGQGTDTEAATRSAIDKAINELSQKYMGQTQSLSVKANAVFDELTQHSRNQKISVEKAMKDSIDRAMKEKETK